MQKEIVIVGLNHRSAPIEVRESVAFESTYLRDALSRLHSYPSIHEGVILSTCNRVEVVAAASDCVTAYNEISRFLGEQKRIAMASLSTTILTLPRSGCGAPFVSRRRQSRLHGRWRAADPWAS